MISDIYWLPVTEDAKANSCGDVVARSLYMETHIPETEEAVRFLIASAIEAPPKMDTPPIGFLAPVETD